MKKVVLLVITVLSLIGQSQAAVNHISFNDQTTHGRLLRRSLQEQEEGVIILNEILATMALMIDGDGSNSTQFTYVTTKFGFSSNADAKAAWDELNSLASKLNADGNVSFVNAAMKQAFNKFR